MHTPLKKYPEDKKLKRKPSITKQILVDIHKRRFLLKTLFLSQNDSEKKIRTLSNKLNKTIAFAKKIYFSKILDKMNPTQKRFGKYYSLRYQLLPTNFLQKQ